MRQTMFFPTLRRVLDKLPRYLIIRGSIALVSGASKQIIGPGELLGLQKGTLSQLSEHHWDFSGQFIYNDFSHQLVTLKESPQNGRKIQVKDL